MESGKLEVTNNTADAILNLQVPTKMTVVWPVLGLCSIFRRLMHNIARIASPIFKQPCETLGKKLRLFTKEELDIL